jgi:LytS/YehU family sensor histidine kinase
MDLARGYLAVEQVRFGPRLAVDTTIAPEASGCLVPPLLLQPLVENAVVHGIGKLLDGGTVRIDALRRGEQLVITVENPRDPEAPASRGQGFGLANVRARLDALHDAEADLRVKEERDRFTVTVTLPAVNGDAR